MMSVKTGEPRPGKTEEVRNDFSLWKLLDHTRYMVFRSRELELAQFGVTPEQAFVLDILQSEGGVTTIGRVVEMSQRKHNSISALVDRMTKQGLVRKVRSRRDRRSFRIFLTEKGRTLFHTLPQDSVNRAFLCLKQDEKDQLTRCLNRVLESAYDSAGIPSPRPAQA